MINKPLTPRDIARRDVEEAIDYYVSEAGLEVSLQFGYAIRAAYDAIVDHPAIGSPLHGHDLKIIGLRSRALKRFPYRLFYIEHPTFIEIWRVLHVHRDIPASLLADEN